MEPNHELSIRYADVFGLRIGFGPMLHPDADLSWFSLDRYFFFMHRCAIADPGGHYIEFWQLRVLWFYVGRQWPITLDRFMEWAEA